MSRILIAESDPSVASFLEKGLRASGWSTHTVSDGQQAEELGLSEDFDLMILDMGLLRDEGLRILRAMRASGRAMPVLALSGDRHTWDVVACLDNGADDYMKKPFRIDELLARIRARLRTATAAPGIVGVGDVMLDMQRRVATVRGRAVDLTSREFSLLETMLRHPGQVLTRDQLRQHSWGHSPDRGDHLVNVYISALRRKLGCDVVETVRGVGYRVRGQAA